MEYNAMRRVRTDMRYTAPLAGDGCADPSDVDSRGPFPLIHMARPPDRRLLLVVFNLTLISSNI